MPRNLGFLMVAMEPPPALEEEFNDWYDMEHVPERKAVDGFESATRFVCVKGWPRYLAFYDLRDAGVIEAPGYAAISGAHFSPWSKRILGRVRGLWRAFGEQCYPGEARIGPMTRLLLLRFRHVDVADEQKLIVRTRELFESRPAVRQVRVVRNMAETGGAYREYAALIALSDDLDPGPLGLPVYGELATHIDAVNEYMRYEPRSPIAGVFPH